MASPQYAGLTFRKWQFGVESTAGTPVAATYNPLVQGHPTPEVTWEDIPHDANQFESKILPVKTGEQWQMPLTGAALFNTLPFWFLGLLKGGVTPTGSTAKTWTFTPSQTTDDLDTYTAEYGSNIHAWRGSFVVLRSLELTMPETGGMWTLAVDATGNSFGSNTFTSSGSVTLDTSPSPLLGAFTKVYIDDAAGSIGGTQVTGALRKGSVKIEQVVDYKILDGDGFAYDAVGRGERMTDVTLSFEQTTASRNEVLQYLKNHVTVPAMRYVRLQILGNVISGGQERVTLDLPGTWKTFGFEEIGQNIVYTLTGRVKYDATLGYGLKATVVNSKASY